MVFSRPLKRRLLPSLLTGLVLLLILSSSSSPNTIYKQKIHPTPSPTVASLNILSCRVLPCMIPGDTPGIAQFIDTWNNTHLFQSFDYSISNPAIIAKHYDFVWGAAVSHIAAIRSGNPKIYISYYIPFHRDSGTFSDISAYHDLTYWKANHPDWILYKCDRVTPAYEFGDPNMPLDFANPALVSWQIQSYARPASERGYDAIAADNVNLQNFYHACGVYIHGKWVQRYSGQLDDPQWRADIVSWLARMQQALHHLRHPLALIPNLALGNLSPGDRLVQQVVSHIDGVLDEDGFTDGARGYLTGSSWVQRIQFMESVQAQYKPYYVVNQFQIHSISRDQVQWALASYLMGKEHTAAVFISTYQGYGADTRYNEYNAQIGSPQDNMYQSQNVYWRDYTNGLSIVNPNPGETYEVTLRAGRKYIDLYGSPVGQTITLPPHSGIVLLTSS